jgi:hypothetical protein
MTDMCAACRDVRRFAMVWLVGGWLVATVAMRLCIT